MHDKEAKYTLVNAAEPFTATFSVSKKNVRNLFFSCFFLSRKIVFQYRLKHINL